MRRIVDVNLGGVNFKLDSAQIDPILTVPRLNRQGEPMATLNRFVLPLLLASACGAVPPPLKPPVTQQRPLAALLEASAYPNSSTVLILTTLQQILALHREWDGYQYFGRLAEEQPARRALFRALQGTMQARV